jgi:hypothetical protein
MDPSRIPGETHASFLSSPGSDGSGVETEKKEAVGDALRTEPSEEEKLRASCGRQGQDSPRRMAMKRISNITSVLSGVSALWGFKESVRTSPVKLCIWRSTTSSDCAKASYYKHSREEMDSERVASGTATFW